MHANPGAKPADLAGRREFNGIPRTLIAFDLQIGLNHSGEAEFCGNGEARQRDDACGQGVAGKSQLVLGTGRTSHRGTAEHGLQQECGRPRSQAH